MKRPGENKKNHMVMSVNIATGELRRWKSIAAAARAVDVNVITITRAVKKVRASGNFVWCNPGDEQRAIEMADYMRKNGIEPQRRGRPKKNRDDMVWLQIDSHTRIMVRPEEATPEFAIKYKNKLKNQLKS